MGLRQYIDYESENYFVGLKTKKDERMLIMNFYKISTLGCEESVVFRCEENYNSNSMALDYAVKNKILPESFETRTLTVSQADETEYTNHLLGKMYEAFYKELEKIKESWKSKTPDEICSECYKAVYIGDIMYILSETDPSVFEYGVLEKWLDNPDEMVKIIFNRVENGDFSSYNDRICRYIAYGLEWHLRS